MSERINRRQFLGATATALVGGVAATGSASAHYVGLSVYTTDDLNTRTGPGTENAIVATVEQFTGGHIVDGPVSADGFTWWEVEWNGDSNNGRVTGWSAANWIAHADFAYPTVGTVSQEHHSGHLALDVANNTGTDVVAARGGTVAITDFEAGGCGNYVKVSHGGGYQTMYCHLSRILVSEGESVALGEHVGEMGDTGNSTGPHLHFTVEHDLVHQFVPGDLGEEIDDRTGLPKNYAGIGTL